MQFVEATHIVDILREAGPDGLNVADIAKKVTEIRKGPNDSTDIAEIEPSKISTSIILPLVGAILNVPLIGHILRLLATNHWIRELKPDVFTNNRISSLLDSGKSVEQLKNQFVPFRYRVFPC